MSGTSDRLSAALAEHYRIERELGQGGMATVYLAEDLKHKRKVALKVLKPELAAVLGAERFVQEITTTASLQHPHILPLFDSGTADGFLYYVMPFIEGETLRERLSRETQLGVDESVRMAREVADALDYAHRRGVIHRDIKPENILLHDQRPMVADFGIALAVSAAAGGRMTETGLSLGTPHYMSPEQATADKEISARSDVYSLASVLYEMLAGQPPHTGGSAQQTIMKIITEAAAPVTHWRRTVPPNVAAALAKALEKLPADRFASAREFSDALADPHFAVGTPATPAGLLASRPTRAAILALGTALILMTGIAAWALLRPEPPRNVTRYALALPDAQLPDPLGFVAISPDGSRIVYLGRSPRSPAFTQLWVKSRDSLQATPLPGTETASAIAISPDNQSLAVIQAGTLRRMPMAGGALTLIAERVSNVSGAVTWLDDNSIVYVSREQKLVRIPSSGGTGTVVWTADSVTLSSLTPLPGARGVLFQTCRAPCSDGNVWVLDLHTTTARELRRNARVAYYLPKGHLLYVQDDVMIGMTVPFDLKALQVRGDPVPVLDSIAFDAGTTPYIDVSASGTLVMRRGTTISGGEFELVWVDRAGRETAVDSSFRFRVTQTAGNYAWALSPDGNRLALGLNTTEGDDIWVKSLPRGPVRRVTFGTESDARPRWTADGRYVTYIGDNGIFLRRADGTGSDSMLWRGLSDEAFLTPDRQWLLLRRGATSASAGGRDIFAVRQGAGDTTLIPLIVTSYDESALALSPGARWIAYTSDETGQVEVFVRPFPNTNDGKEQISNGGGRAPLWSRDGREFYYLRADNMMMAVTVPTGDDWARAEPRELFRLRDALAVLEPSYYTPWDIAPDGRFIFARSIDRGRDRRAPLIVMENWFGDLKPSR